MESKFKTNLTIDPSYDVCEDYCKKESLRMELIESMQDDIDMICCD